MGKHAYPAVESGLLAGAFEHGFYDSVKAQGILQALEIEAPHFNPLAVMRYTLEALGHSESKPERIGRLTRRYLPIESATEVNVDKAVAILQRFRAEGIIDSFTVTVIDARGPRTYSR